MKFLLLALFVLGTSAFACDVLFLDFNDSKNEVQRCYDGVKENNAADGVSVVGGGKAVTAGTIEAKLKQYKEHGACVDTMVISGHQIAGEFSGSHGAIGSGALRRLIAKYPTVFGENFKVPELWGCYSTVLIRCQNDFLKSLSPNVKTAVGYELQSPSNERQSDWDVAHMLCKTRAEAAEAQDEARLNDYLNSIPHNKDLALGICIDGAVCSRMYRKPGSTEKSCYHTWDELMARCTNAKDFDPHGALASTYEDYYSASDAQHAEPPCEEGDGFNDQETDYKGPNKIREFYSKGPNLWAHCAEKYKADFNYEMPPPGRVIRLIKFCDLKKNVQKLHAKQLAEYNQALDQVGLGDYALSDLNRMSRKQIKEKLTAVINALGDGRALPKPKKAKHAPMPADLISSMFGGGGAALDADDAAATAARPRRSDAVDPKQLSDMANSINATLINLDGHCSDANMLHPEGATHHSACITNLENY